MPRIELVVAALVLSSLPGCGAVDDADGAFRSFVRSCEPTTVVAEIRDGDGTARTFVASCRVVKR